MICTKIHVHILPGKPPPLFMPALIKIKLFLVLPKTVLRNPPHCYQGHRQSRSNRPDVYVTDRPWPGQLSGLLGWSILVEVCSFLAFRCSPCSTHFSKGELQNVRVERSHLDQYIFSGYQWNTPLIPFSLYLSYFDNIFVALLKSRQMR